MKQSGSQCQSSRAPTPRSCSAAITAATALAAIVGCASAPDAGAAQVSAVQFQQQSYDHHFLTTSMTEIAALDGAAAAGWMRSDLEFKVDDTPGPGLVPVCRFYSAAFAPKSSHFFTAFPEECAAVKANPVWTYEGIAFYASLPDAAGNCEGGKMPVYRSYNGGTGGAPAHLYTPIIEDSCTHYGFQPTCVKEGVGPQGIAFCAPVFRTLAQERTQQMSGGTWDFTFEFDGVARTVSMAFGPAVVATVTGLPARRHLFGAETRCCWHRLLGCRRWQDGCSVPGHGAPVRLRRRGREQWLRLQVRRRSRVQRHARTVPSPDGHPPLTRWTAHGAKPAFARRHGSNAVGRVPRRIVDPPPPVASRGRRNTFRPGRADRKPN